MKRTLLFTLAITALMASPAAFGQSKSIDEATLNQIKKSFKNDASDKAIRNAMGNCDLKALAVNEDNQNTMDTHFTIEVKSKGITDQQKSGRCWLFSGLNTMRAKVIAKYNPDSFEFSQVYLSFYDQLEKANIFLERIIDTAKKPMDDKTVDWLFHNVIGDGGNFTGVADLISKYGAVPREAMHETKSSNNTSQMNRILELKLREFALQIREAAAKGTSVAQLEKQKVGMLQTIYRVLALSLGVPPTQFTYTMRDAKGNIIDSATYTPQSFRDKYIDKDAYTGYIMLMNDPTRPYYKNYQVDFDRHVYDGRDWTYVNLPMEDIKEMAIASLKDSTMMYFSCDVGKELDSKRGLLDVNNFDYASLLGTTFNMDKKQRIQSFASGSTHAMCLMAVDLNKDGKPTKWMVENSWGSDNGYKGHLIMTDNWFNEYMFRLVIKGKYATDRVFEISKVKPIKLPSWDPMFRQEE
jgi:bleomycin hydrolase